jgi:ribosomal protein L37AE/L43A
VSRHIANPEGLAILAHVVADLHLCPDCGNNRHLVERENPRDPRTETITACETCAFEHSGLAYVEQPSPRERALHAAAGPQPDQAGPQCQCGAHGDKGPWHRYTCPRYSPNPERDAA